MPTWIIVCLVIIILFAWGYLSNKNTKRKFDELFFGRPERSDGEYYENFYDGADIPADVVTKVRQIFSEQIGIDLSALEPDDDLSGDYSLIWEMDSMADVEIIIAIETEFDIKITDAEAAEMRSLHTIFEVVSAKLKDKKLG
uniref:Acyl carrier protein n=1 Tax=uncultured microorganism TaxID=358574 RepID=K0J6N6_9ZZZZ|nr:acyl carrier protein [uncultured microorganism]